MTFDPNKHLMDLSGKAYLEVKWRIVWFRQDCPGGTIDTEEMEVDTQREVEAEVPTGNWIPNPNRPGKKMPEKVMKQAHGYARYRAVVTDGKGGRATATKSENAASFEDYCEKAETGAVGRALAMLGYGTAFTGDELSEEHRLVDAPVEGERNGHAPQAQQRVDAPAPVAAKPSALDAAIAEVKREFETAYPDFVKGNPDWWNHFQRTVLGSVPAAPASTDVAKLRRYLADKRVKQPATQKAS